MDKFTKVKNIGKGNMGTCALARNNEDGNYYVIKQVDLTHMNKKERQQSLNEARLLNSLKHPNIINYVDSFLAKRSDHLCIVMEYADGGDLSSRIRENYGTYFRESQVIDWFIEIALSLNYVHQHKVLHRDVKTQNIFLMKNNVIKLGDFGIARSLAGTYDQARTFVGTPYYLSPELILEKPYDHRSDVWAVGVVLYEVLALKHPFNASDMKGLMQRILKVQYDPLPNFYSVDTRNLVGRLLMKDPSQRLSFAEVLALPMIHRRMCDWLRGDVMPSSYIDALLRNNLLPSSVMQDALAKGKVADMFKELVSSSLRNTGSSATRSAGTSPSHAPVLKPIDPSQYSHSYDSLSKERSESNSQDTQSTSSTPRPAVPLASDNGSWSLRPSVSPKYSRVPMPLAPNPPAAYSSPSAPMGQTPRTGRLEDFYQHLNRYQHHNNGYAGGAAQGRTPFVPRCSAGNAFPSARPPPTYNAQSRHIDIRAMLQRAAADRAQRIQRSQQPGI